MLRISKMYYILFLFFLFPYENWSIEKKDAFLLIQSSYEKYSSMILTVSCDAEIIEKQHIPYDMLPQKIKNNLSPPKENNAYIEDTSQSSVHLWADLRKENYRNDWEMLSRTYGTYNYPKDDPEPQLLKFKNLETRKALYVYDQLKIHTGKYGLYIYPSNQRTEARVDVLDPKSIFLINNKSPKEYYKHHSDVEDSYPDTLKIQLSEDNEHLTTKVIFKQMDNSEMVAVYSKEHDFLLKRYYQNIKNIENHDIRIEWDEIKTDNGEKVYFPKEYHAEYYRYGEGKVLPQYSRSILFKNVVINKPIPDSKFTLEDMDMVADTVVIDKVADKTYDLALSGLVKKLKPSAQTLKSLNKLVDESELKKKQNIKKNYDVESLNNIQKSVIQNENSIDQPVKNTPIFTRTKFIILLLIVIISIGLFYFMIKRFITVK